eukprot:Hpha_TRINITY_DN14127_c0_g1::TRINITY_DN14127_c0_g1_i1::g.11109::m.11109
MDGYDSLDGVPMHRRKGVMIAVGLGVLVLGVWMLRPSSAAAKPVMPDTTAAMMMAKQTMTGMQNALPALPMHLLMPQNMFLSQDAMAAHNQMQTQNMQQQQAMQQLQYLQLQQQMKALADAKAAVATPPSSSWFSFSTVMMVALLGVVMYYGAGHFRGTRESDEFGDAIRGRGFSGGFTSV